MDEYFNKRGMAPTRVETVPRDTHQIPSAEKNDVDIETNAAGCNCDRWGHPCPNCVDRDISSKPDVPFSSPVKMKQ